MKNGRFSTSCLRATETAGPAALSTFCAGALLNEVSKLWPYVLLITLFTWVISFLFNAFIFGSKKADGTLLIDTSNPDRDIWRLDLSEGFETLTKKKAVTFNVELNADLSQK